MKCDIDTLKEMRNVINESLGEVDKDVRIDSEGSSREFGELYLKELLKDIRNPEAMLEALQERIQTLEKPLHKALKRELGEIVYIDEKKLYLKESFLNKNPNVQGGVEMVLVLANDRMETSTYRFGMNSDKAIVSTGSGIGTLEGISDIFVKVLIDYGREVQNAKVSNVEVDTLNVPELKETLHKMVIADEVLGSRQNRNSEDLIGYEEIKNYKHGDINSMKEILHRLHVLGNSKATREELSYYKDLLERMHPRFFNEMRLYLKKNDVLTEGFIDLAGEGIYVKSSLAQVEGQSEAEVYMHEVIHSMTAWALRQKDKSLTALKTQLNNAQKVAQQNTTWQDFLTVPESRATEYDTKRAQKIYEYLFVGENSIDEFIAYTLTNPTFMRKMQEVKMSAGKKEPKTVYEKIINIITKVFDVVFGKYDFRNADESIFKQVNDIAFRLAEVNNEQQLKLERMNPFGIIGRKINDLDRSFASLYRGFVKKISNEDKRINVPGENAGVMEKAAFILKVTTAGVTNPLYRGWFGLWFSAFGIRPESTIREIVSSFADRDEVFRAAEKLKMLKDSIDAMRNSQIDANVIRLKQSFSRDLSKEEDRSMTRVLLDTGLASLRYERNKKNKLADKDIIKLLTDEEYRKGEENRLKTTIHKMLAGSEEGRTDWTITQAVTLGYYLATHKSNIGQNFNGNNIDKGYGLPQKFQSVKGLAEVVEELATVVSLKHTKQADKDMVVSLMKTERKGINAITDAYQSYKKFSEEQLFADGNDAHRMMGHSKELFDSSIDITVAPVEKRAELESSGYTFKYVLSGKNGDKYKTPMALYVTPQFGKVERLAGAVGLGDDKARGTTMSSLKRIEDPVLSGHLFARDFAKVRQTSLKVHKDMASGMFDVTSLDYGMAPIINKSGEVTDFRYMMSKEEKEELLMQDTSAIQVMARSLPSVAYGIEVKKHNERALNAIKLDMKENWKEGRIGEDGYTEYFLVTKDSNDPEMAATYDMLPDSYKEYIESRTDKTMAVRRDLFYTYFGYRHLRLSDMKGINMLPRVVKDFINMVEGLWMELIKISKAAILMKMPLVLIQNIISNVRYMIATGSFDIFELAKDYRDSFREVGEYIATNRNLTKIKQEILADKASLDRVRNRKALEDKIYKKEVEARQLEGVLERNPARELFLSGMYQSYIEDVETSQLSETNKVVRMVGKRMDKAPKVVRKAAEIAYITQNTKWYKVSQEVMQRTDMMARLVENKRMLRNEAEMADGTMKLPVWWVETKRKDDKNYPETKKLVGNERREFIEESKKQRMLALMDHYINYTLPNGRGEEYLNRMGFLMFTKYLKRIQKVVVETVTSHPLKSSISLLSAELMPGGESFLEQSFLSRAVGNDGSLSIFNIVPMYGIDYHLSNIFTPAIVKDELYMNML